MIGTELQGRYRLIRRLGRGSMGEVFLAEHLLLRRHEAIKVLRASSAHSPEHAARFRREARALNRVTHPNIVAVHDFGQLDDGRFFLAMEYAEGRSLDLLLKERRRLPLLRALHILAKVADAVEHAHCHGVIHRDLKPSNVVLVVDRRGEEPKVLDFGLAKIVSPGYSDSVGGTNGNALGTPYYMAPELISNKTFDDRIDIYSLGCMAFELLTGKPPFVGQLMAICQSHLAQPPPHLWERSSGKNLPREVDELIQSCLRKRPEDRIQSAWQIAEVVRHIIADLGPTDGVPKAVGDLDTQRTANLETTRRRRLRRPRVTDGTTAKHKALPHMDFGKTLTELARAILDQGCDDVGLIVDYAALGEAESTVRRYEGELEGIRWRRVMVEQHYRERVASLRFALSELRFALKRREYASGRSGIEKAIRSLDRRLGSVERRAQEELSTLDEAGNSASRGLERARDRLRDQRLSLYEVVAKLMPYYGSVDLVAHLWEQLTRSSMAAESA